MSVPFHIVSSMRTQDELHELRLRAVALRRAGKSVREIKQALGPISNRTLNDALREEPPPEWTRHPNAKDDLRAKATTRKNVGSTYHGCLNVRVRRGSRLYRKIDGWASAAMSTPPG